MPFFHIRRLASGALLLGLASLMSRLLGLVRDNLFSRIFGATQGQGIYDLDAYYAAFRLPDLLYQLLIYGAISSAFIPLFAETLEKGDELKTWRFANSVLNIFGAILIGLSALLFLFAPVLVSLYVPGFSEEKLALTVTLTRILLLSPIFFGFSSILQSISNTFHRYFAIAFTPVIYNLAIIAATYFFAPHSGVFAVAFGVIAGAVLQFFLQFPTMISLKFCYRILFPWKDPHIRELFRLFVPRMLALSIFQLNLLVDTILASMLITGSITVLNFAFNVTSLPMGIVGISIAIVSFATLARLSAKGEHEKFSQELRENFTKILVLIVPAAVGLFLLSPEIVTLIFRSQKFSLDDISMTSRTLSYFTIGLLAYSTIPLLVRGFYAKKNTKTPVLISIFSFFLNVALSLSFLFVFHLRDVSMLALSNAIASLINMALLILFIRRYVRPLSYFFDLGKIFLAASFMGGAVWLIRRVFLENSFSFPFMTLLWKVALVIVGAILLYFLLLHVFGYRKLLARTPSEIRPPSDLS